MALREPTQPVDFLRDVVWGDEEVTKPNPMQTIPEKAKGPAPIQVQRPAHAAPHAPAAPAPPISPDAAQLRRLLEFVQWERVAMVRFGLASAAWAATSYEPVSIFSRRADAGDIEEQRRTRERAIAMMRDNRAVLEKALADLTERLRLADPDFL